MLTHYRSALTALIAMLLSAAVFASVGDDEVPEVTARVARVSFVRGDVKVRRSGEDEWETADLNLPLVEGDELTTGADGRVELQFGSKTHLRAERDSYIQIKQLSDDGIAVSISAGSVTARLRKFESEKEFFELDAPGTTVSAQKEGAYRIDAGAPGSSELRVTVTSGGEARVYSRDSGFQLRSGRSAKLFIEGDNEGEWETADAGRLADEFDTWAAERDEAIAKLVDTAKYGTIYDQDIYGAEDLNDNGSWDYTSDYGYIWQPNASAISGYHDWSPYRYGSWRWVPPFGWTWVNDEPWGWATYHHGRWIWYRNRWVWTPYGHYRDSRSWWRPALVVIKVIDRNVCWYPLGYKHRYTGYNRRDHDWIGNRDRRRPQRNDDRLPRIGGRPGLPQQGEPIRQWPADETVAVKPTRLKDLDTTVPTTGVVSMPAENFGVRRRAGRTAPPEIARAALKTNFGNETSPAELPDPRSLRTRPNRDFTAQPPQVITKAPGPTRTGASERRRGVPLDGELRKSRIFGNRPQAPVTPEVQLPTNGRETPRRTGAVGRPVPPRRNVETPSVDRTPTEAPRISTAPANPQPRVVTPQPQVVARPQRERQKPREDDPQLEPSRRREMPRPREETPQTVPPPRRDPPAQRQDSPPQRIAPPARQNAPVSRQDQPRSTPSKSNAPKADAPKRQSLRGRKQAPID